MEIQASFLRDPGLSLSAIAKMAPMLRCKVCFGRLPVTYIHSCDDPMVATLLTPPTESIHLSGISWQTYETLLQELSDRRLRLTYNRGNQVTEISYSLKERYFFLASASLLT